MTVSKNTKGPMEVGPVPSSSERVLNLKRFKEKTE